jgi:hypothetical protein
LKLVADVIITHIIHEKARHRGGDVSARRSAWIGYLGSSDCGFFKQKLYFKYAAITDQWNGDQLDWLILNIDERAETPFYRIRIQYPTSCQRLVLLLLLDLAFLITPLPLTTKLQAIPPFSSISRPCTFAPFSSV